MPRSSIDRTESYPSITARKHWLRYAAGMATEALFVLALTVGGLVLALIASVVWR